MAYPTKPDGALRPSWFGVDVADGSWDGNKPTIWYMYAIVPFIREPVAWGGSTYSDGNPLPISVSRAVWVDDGSYYDDTINWMSPDGLEQQLLSTETLADITNTIEWTERQTSSETSPHLANPWPAPGCSFGVLEIRSWDDTEESLGSLIVAFSVEFGHTEQYHVPSASSVRQHIDRMPAELTAPGSFASAYQMQWGIAEGINRAIYEDRHSNTWPVARFSIFT